MGKMPKRKSDLPEKTQHPFPTGVTTAAQIRQGKAKTPSGPIA